MIFKLYTATLTLLNIFRFFRRGEVRTLAKVLPFKKEIVMSETLKVELVCSKELTELGQGIAKFLAAIKLASADGWQVGQDLPALVASATADLFPAVQGVTLIKEEYADKKAFMNAVAVIGSAVAGAVL